MTRHVLLIFLAVVSLLRADLTKARAEPNLEKRAKAALDNAGDALKQARHAYGKDDRERMQRLLAEVQESVDLSQASLKETGKDPRRSPKAFKRAEMDLSQLLKHVESFEREMNVADRPLLEDLKKKIQQAHEEMVLGIMVGKRK